MRTFTNLLVFIASLTAAGIYTLAFAQQPAAPDPRRVLVAVEVQRNEQASMVARLDAMLGEAYDKIRALEVSNADLLKKCGAPCAPAPDTKK